MRNRLERSLFAATLVVVCLIGIFLWGFNRTLELPTPSGPFGVGRVVYAALPGKTLALVVWYPIDKDTARTLAPYNPTIAGRALDGEPGVMEQNLSSVHAHSMEGVSISLSQPKYPVLVLWPGYGWQPSRYTILAEELASEGYVVAGISPDYGTGNLDDTLTSRQTVERWAPQMISVVTRLDSMNAVRSRPFTGRLNLARVGFLGHSIGGAVSLEACSSFDRCGGAIDLDGSVYGSVVTTGTTKPLLFIMGEAYPPPNLPGFRRSRATFDSSAARDSITIGHILAHSPNAARVVIPGFRHAYFTDQAVFFDPFSRLDVLFGGGSDPLNGLENVSANVQAFFDRHIAVAH